jgi:hydrogenase/urease accessory protein HupE
MKPLKSIGAVPLCTEEDLHLHHVAHGKPKAFENGLDPVQHADRLGFGVAIGLQARGIGVLVGHRRHLTADVIGREIASDLD